MKTGGVGDSLQGPGQVIGSWTRNVRFFFAFCADSLVELRAGENLNSGVSRLVCRNAAIPKWCAVGHDVTGFQYIVSGKKALGVTARLKPVLGDKDVRHDRAPNGQTI